MRYLASFTLLAGLAAAQSNVIDAPRDSQRASVSQRIELTDITIRYHRPLAKGRKLLGGILPLGEVWRAGANENTTIEFSDPVMIEGHRLAKGVYGLHMIPKQDSWTIVFSNASNSWGSYTYDEKEDALRVTVQPISAAAFTDALTYEFDDLQLGSAMVVMRWDKLGVGFKVSADREATLSRLREQLRGLAKFAWDGWADAADWCVSHNTNLDEALNWTDHSIQMEEHFENLMLKARALEALHRDSETAALKTRALQIGGVVQVYSYGRRLSNEKHKSEAIEVYRTVATRFPDHWIGSLAQARVAFAAGDVNAAKQALDKAEAAAPQAQKVGLQGLRKRLNAGEDING